MGPAKLPPMDSNLPAQSVYELRKIVNPKETAYTINYDELVQTT